MRTEIDRVDQREFSIIDHQGFAFGIQSEVDVVAAIARLAVCDPLDPAARRDETQRRDQRISLTKERRIIRQIKPAQLDCFIGWIIQFKPIIALQWPSHPFVDTQIRC